VEPPQGPSCGALQKSSYRVGRWQSEALLEVPRLEVGEAGPAEAGAGHPVAVGRLAVRGRQRQPRLAARAPHGVA